MLLEILKFIDETFEIDQALNGQLAIDLVLSKPTYNMIFLDINMPVLNGYEVIYLNNKFK